MTASSLTERGEDDSAADNVASLDEASLQLAACDLAESTLKRALAVLICEAIDDDVMEGGEGEGTAVMKEEVLEEADNAEEVAKCLVTQVLREAWQVYLMDCDLTAFLEEDPETNMTRHMAQELLKKAKADKVPDGGAARTASSKHGPSQVDLDFFQAPKEHTTTDPIFPQSGDATAAANGRPAPPSGPPRDVTAAGASAPPPTGEVFRFDGNEQRVDLRLVNPYLPVLAKVATIDKEGNEVAILLFDSSKLPSRSTPDYDQIMHNVFLLSMFWVEQHMFSNYSIVYLHGNSSKDHWPKPKWLKQWCNALSNKTSKHLSHMFVVFPTIWLRTLRIISRPFVKIKASIHFVSSVRALLQQLPEAEGVLPKGMMESTVAS